MVAPDKLRRSLTAAEAATAVPAGVRGARAPVVGSGEGTDDIVIGHGAERTPVEVTGEGSLDAQSLNGKVPLRIAESARADAVPVSAVTGRADIAGEVGGVFDRIGEIVAEVRPGEDPFAGAGATVRRLTARLIGGSALCRT